MCFAMPDIILYERIRSLLNNDNDNKNRTHNKGRILRSKIQRRIPCHTSNVLFLYSFWTSFPWRISIPRILVDDKTNSAFFVSLSCLLVPRYSFIVSSIPRATGVPLGHFLDFLCFIHNAVRPDLDYHGGLTQIYVGKDQDLQRMSATDYELRQSYFRGTLHKYLTVIGRKSRSEC